MNKTSRVSRVIYDFNTHLLRFVVLIGFIEHENYSDASTYQSKMCGTIIFGEDGALDVAAMYLAGLALPYNMENYPNDKCKPMAGTATVFRGRKLIVQSARSRICCLAK